MSGSAVHPRSGASQPVATRDSTFVFVTGLHRSGTSLLRDLLAHHSMTSTLRETGVIEDEGQFLQDVLPLPKLHGGPGRFAWRQQARFTEDDVAAFADPGGRMCAGWAPYWRGGGEVYVEKSPANITRCRFLHAVFPRSKFVYMLRHPVAVSYATQKWTPLPVTAPVRRMLPSQLRHVPMAQLLRHWVRANTIAAADVGFLGGDAMFVRYEDLLADPDAVLARVQEFLDLPVEQLPTGSVRGTGNDRYLARWRERLDVRVPLLRAPFRHVDAICALFGYDLARCR